MGKPIDLFHNVTRMLDIIKYITDNKMLINKFCIIIVER